MSASSPPGQRTGLAYGLAAYLAWGLLPLYFRALHGVPPLEILAHRIAWSMLLLAGLTTWLRRWPEVARPLATRRGRLTLLATTGLISVNWGVYIWAVHAGRVLEASLGYFINPLVNVLLGVLFLGEALSRRQRVAVALAGLGVAALVASAGALPWVALVLATSFGFYGLLRKRERVDAVAGLFSETALLAGPHRRRPPRRVGRHERAPGGGRGGHRAAPHLVRARRAAAAPLHHRAPPVPRPHPAVRHRRLRLRRALHRGARRGLRLHLDLAGALHGRRARGAAAGRGAGPGGGSRPWPGRSVKLAAPGAVAPPPSRPYLLRP
jgi:RarD protein